MQQTGYGPNQRAKARIKKILGPVVDMTVFDGGTMTRTRARIVDFHESGLGFLAYDAISPGSIVSFEDEKQETRRAKVAWCQKTRSGEYRLGVGFENLNSGADGELEVVQTETVDYYELLQLNPKADTETIHRVFRLQAQRFHPDNKETGNATAFQSLHEAYTVLTDAEKRAEYDLRLSKNQKPRSKTLEKPVGAQGIEAEIKKREQVLTILYTKRIQSPGSPAVSIAEFENLLGVAKEELEFALWYLRENGSAVRSDNAKFAITVQGVDAVERNSRATPPAPVVQMDRLLN